MTTKNDGKNRRKHARYSTKAQIKIKESKSTGKELEFKVGKTENLSLSGANCLIDTFIPAFTNVEGTMVLPYGSKDDFLIQFKGVVVRITPVQEVGGTSQYNVAVFFKGMKEKEVQKVAKYIDSVKG